MRALIYDLWWLVGMFGCSDSGYVLVVWIYLLCLKFAGGVGLDLIVGFGVGIYGWFVLFAGFGLICLVCSLCCV